MAPHPDSSPAPSGKAALRKSVLAARDGLDAEHRRDASAAIARTLIDLPALSAARLMGGFWPIRSEVDPRAAMTALAAAGRSIALPCVTPDGLVFRAWEPGQRLVQAKFGLSEPDPALPEVFPDALIVPLAAFDRMGRRLGYGRGYYDGAIERLSREHPVVTVGVAFAAQEVPEVPVEPHDRALDAIVTEMGLVQLERPAE